MQKACARLFPLSAVFDLDSWLTSEYAKTFSRRRDVGAEDRSGEHLTVRAVADSDHIKIDFRLERDFPAVAISLNFHRALAYRLNPYALNLIGGKALASAIV
jgi:hypothetical protein